MAKYVDGDGNKKTRVARRLDYVLKLDIILGSIVSTNERAYGIAREKEGFHFGFI